VPCGSRPALMLPGAVLCVRARPVRRLRKSESISPQSRCDSCDAAYRRLGTRHDEARPPGRLMLALSRLLRPVTGWWTSHPRLTFFGTVFLALVAVVIVCVAGIRYGQSRSIAAAEAELTAGSSRSRSWKAVARRPASTGRTRSTACASTTWTATPRRPPSSSGSRPEARRCVTHPSERS
jgi:hypothetical protein